VLGVLRRRKTLDHFIEKYSRRRVEKLDLDVLIALRLGIYQIRYLTRIPESAAVNESVNLVKRARFASAAGMVNAVLRNAARHKEDKAGEGISDSIERASVETSHPRWMIKRWIDRLGESDAIRLAEANNETPHISFRINTLLATQDEVTGALQNEGVSVISSTITPGAFIVESGQASSVIQAAQQGLIYIQDEASQLVSLLVAPREGERILDLCAAPGSKSSHLAMLTSNQSHIIACDIHSHRLVSLKEICNKLNADSVTAVALDATRELPFDSNLKFDRVLIDAPCTGTGTLRRNPEIKWRLSSETISQMAGVQIQLLKRAADVTKPGGRLVYSTCSIEREENEEVIERFFSGNNQFRLIRPEAHTNLITGEGFLRTFPHLHNTDGFFAAVLEKSN
jgi:16S rRNA (cytosine967-C5)-methyltransferase